MGAVIPLLDALTQLATGTLGARSHLTQLVSDPLVSWRVRCCQSTRLHADAEDIVALAETADRRLGSLVGVCVTRRDVWWPNCLNARDLSGLPVRGGGVLRSGVFIRSDSLSRLSDEGCAAVRLVNPARIVDLRAAWECEKEPSSFESAPGYVRVPLVEPAGAPRATTLAGRYRDQLHRCADAIAVAVAAIADAPEGTVVVHCHSGKDRTGLLVGLVLSAVGVPADSVAADYTVSADRLAALHAAELTACKDRGQRTVLRELRSARPETMRATLAYLEREFGGAARYLERLGLRRAQLAALSERFVHVPAEVPG